MDRNERILTRVLRERSQHRGWAAVRSHWPVVGAVVLVVSVTLVQIAALRPAGVTSNDADEYATAPSPISEVEAEVRAPTVSATTAPRAASIEPPIVPSAGGHVARYVVRPDESLQTIAARYHLSATTLISINELTDPDLLQPGRELLIPDTDGILHVVEPGETLRSIADRYGSATDALVEANALSAPDHIPVGLRLFVPRTRALAASTTDR